MLTLEGQTCSLRRAFTTKQARHGARRLRRLAVRYLFPSTSSRLGSIMTWSILREPGPQPTEWGRTERCW